jgi:hypothetical protein
MADRQHQNIGMTLVSPESLIDADSGDWLEIEQKPWPEKPDGGFIAWAFANGKELTPANGLIYYNMFKSHCLEDGSCEVELWVHKSRPDLNYAITASYGELGPKQLGTGEHVRSETVEKTDHLDLERQIAGNFSAVWEGKVIGEDLGFIQPPPTITRDGSLLSWGVVCTGTLRLKYTEEHDTFILTITPRPAGEFDPTDLDTAYQSTVTAVFEGGDPVVHEVDLPEMTGHCGGSSSSIDPDDDEGDCYDLHIKYHQCTGEEISRDLVRVPCPDDEGEET